MEANNNAPAEKPIETHLEDSILDEPDPPDRVMDETGVDGEQKGNDEPMDVSEEKDNTPQKEAKNDSDKNKVELGKRTFEFIHPLNDFGIKREVASKWCSLKKSVMC